VENTATDHKPCEHMPEIKTAKLGSEPRPQRLGERLRKTIETKKKGVTQAYGRQRRQQGQKRRLPFLGPSLESEKKWVETKA